MSYINIHKVELEGEEGGARCVPRLAAENEVDSLRDGEELMAAHRLIKALDELGEGEALVVWKDIF